MRITLLVVAALCGVSAAAQEPTLVRYGQGRQLCTLDRKEVDESSGIACSRRTPGVFWTHNDSGDPPRLFAFNAKGEDLAVFQVEGAINRDWEDMASFGQGDASRLVIADVGDNNCEHDSCTVYLVPEPPVDPQKRGVRGKVRIGAAIDFRYEDRAHNCEAVAVDPTSKLIVLVTKALATDCKAYGLRIPEKPGREEVVAKAIAPVKVPIVTGMDVSPDGLRAIVVTYGNAYEFSRRPNEDWAAAFARPPRAVLVPLRRQGEAICYGADGKTLYLTSEGGPCPLFAVPVAGDKQ